MAVYISTEDNYEFLMENSDQVLYEDSSSWEKIELDEPVWTRVRPPIDM